MKNIILLLSGVIIFSMSSGQSLTFKWAKQIGGLNQESNPLVVTDNKGFVYIAGAYTSPSLNIAGNIIPKNDASDFFIAQFDTLGNYKWSKHFNVAGSHNLVDITTDKAGNVYLYGILNGTVNFGGTNLTSIPGQTDIFIGCLSNNGNFLWQKKIGGDGKEVATDIHADRNGDILLLGLYESTNFSVDALTLTRDMNWINYFYAKINSSGTVLWAKKIKGGNDADYPSTPSLFYMLGIHSSNLEDSVFLSGTFLPERRTTEGWPAGTFIKGTGVEFDTSLYVGTSFIGISPYYISFYIKASLSGSVNKELITYGASNTLKNVYAGTRADTRKFYITPNKAAYYYIGIRTFLSMGGPVSYIAGQNYGATVGQPVFGSPAFISSAAEASNNDVFYSYKLFQAGILTEGGIKNLQDTSQKLNFNVTDGFDSHVSSDTINGLLYVSGTFNNTASNKLKLGNDSLNTIGANDIFITCVRNNKVNKLVVNAGIDTVYCNGGTGVSLGGIPAANGGVGTLTYRWTPETGLNNPFIANPIANPVVSTNYILNVTDAKGNKAADTVSVFVQSLPIIVQTGNTLTTNTNFSCQWYKNGQIIAGAVSNSIVITSSGIYTVAVTTPACLKTSLPFSATFLRSGSFFNYNISPNPASDKLIVSYELIEPSTVSVDIFDMNGRRIKPIISSQLQPRGVYSYEIKDIKNYMQSGQYIVRIKQNDKAISVKVLIL